MWRQSWLKDSHRRPSENLTPPGHGGNTAPGPSQTPCSRFPSPAHARERSSSVVGLHPQVRESPRPQLKARPENGRGRGVVTLNPLQVRTRGPGPSSLLSRVPKPTSQKRVSRLFPEHQGLQGPTHPPPRPCCAGLRQRSLRNADRAARAPHCGTRWGSGSSTQVSAVGTPPLQGHTANVPLLRAQDPGP